MVSFIDVNLLSDKSISSSFWRLRNVFAFISVNKLDLSESLTKLSRPKKHFGSKELSEFLLKTSSNKRLKLAKVFGPILAIIFEPKYKLVNLDNLENCLGSKFLNLLRDKSK